MGKESNRNVLLIGNYERDRQESMQRFVATLFEHLPSFGLNVDLAAPGEWLGKLFHSNQGAGKWAGYFDKYILFPRRIRKLVATANEPGFVVHICDHSNSIYTRYLKGIPHLVNCHDLLAVRSARGEIPENPTRWTGRQLQRLILNGLNRAQHVACISEATRRDLLRLSSLSPRQVDVIPMGLNYDYRPVEQPDALKALQRISHAHGIDFLKSRFIIHVGGNQWYKNRLAVLQIYESLIKKDSKIPLLIMVGKPFNEELEHFVENHQLRGQIVSLSSCDNEELRALYSLAQLLLFPSLQEGFGWPIIEAQACGCRVVASDRAPMTEVGGSAASYFDPQNLDASVAVVWKVLNQGVEEKFASIKRGRQNASQYSTVQMVEQYVALYQKLSFQSVF